MTTSDAVEQAGGDPADRSQVGDLLGRLQDSALGLLSGLDRPPRSLRMKVDGVELELEWPDPAAPAAPAAAAAPAGSVVHLAAVPEPETGSFITAETVGVFYTASEPGAEPFVSPGDEVTRGQQVGIVEAMKLMMPVEAPAAGRIVEVLAGNGTSVEYGEKLFSYEPLAG